MWTKKLAIAAESLRKRSAEDVARRRGAFTPARAARLERIKHHQETLRTETISEYPVCPRCPNATSANTIRAGFARGIQIYRCRLCRSRFNGKRFVSPLPDCKLLCYHCGGTNTEKRHIAVNSSRTGIKGFCRSCKRRFIQGGASDLQRYHLLLEKRIADERLPQDIAAEVLQAATLDVLSGKGYCWTVDLRIKEAFRNVRGNGLRFVSEDHPVFRLKYLGE